MLSNLGLIWRTARHLKPVQVYGRFWFKYYKPKVDVSPAPHSTLFKGLTTYPARRNTSLIGPRSWRFLNEEGDLDELGWQDDRRSKLWRYNQHYFDDLNAFHSSNRLIWHRSLIDQWINENAPGSGNGWEPYPTSLRIVNWIKWASSGENLSHEAIKSLAIQSRWLSHRLEWHLLGNHLFANAKALIFAGLYFDGAEGQRWLNKGMQILKPQVPEQILADGGQFELTPMYHALALEDILDLINICRANSGRLNAAQQKQVQSWCELVPKMVHWLNTVSHPDCKISFFNDAAFGIAPENGELVDYARRLGFETFYPQKGLTDLASSGLVRMQSNRATVIADLAKIGPDYLPGHAHADTLSFELSVDGQRIFVNSGTSEYGLGHERMRQRGTAAHNTLCLNNQNSSEVWSGFRVGARARIQNRDVGEAEAKIFASASQDGYARLNNGLVHSRRFSLDDGSLTITDSISKPANAVAHYHLHPSISVRSIESDRAELNTENGRRLKLSIAGASSFKVISTSWHPEFGVTIPNQCLVAEIAHLECNFLLEWD